MFIIMVLICAANVANHVSLLIFLILVIYTIYFLQWVAMKIVCKTLAYYGRGKR
jgi:hypothetical protein